MSVEAVSLGEIATIIAGQSPPGSTYNESGLGLPFFQGKADFGRTHPVARKWCVAPKKIAEAGDILMSVRAPVGPTNIAGERCCIGRGLAAIRPDETIALRDFVHWIIKYREPELIAKGQGSTFVAIGQKDLNSLLVPLPPLDEQRRIAGILNRAARIERLRARTAGRLREFIPALFIKMFGDPIENPMGWDITPLGDVIRVSSGQCLSAKDMLPGDYPVYGGNGINGHHSEFMFEYPKIVIGRVGAYCGVVHVSQPNSWITDNALFVREIRDSINTIYLEWALRMANLNQYAGRAAQPLISGSRIYPVKVLLPDETIQLRFCQITETARTIASVADSASKTASVLNFSLMNRLLGDSP